MLNGFKDYPISFWNAAAMDDVLPNAVKDWHDLGINLAMSPYFGKDDVPYMQNLLRECEKLGIKVILCDYRALANRLNSVSEDEYRETFRQAAADFDGFPAVYGFFVGDEPCGSNIDKVCTAAYIQKEEAPHLSPYINLFPWGDGSSKRIGVATADEYVGRVVDEGKIDLVSYDCYGQMNMDCDHDDGYFTNLRVYGDAARVRNLPFMSIVLSTALNYYRLPDYTDLAWQLATSAVHGASAVSWFIIHEPYHQQLDTFRGSPINRLGERTPQFTNLSEVNRIFQENVGRIFAGLTHENTTHVLRAFGGFPNFEPDGDIIAIETNNPLAFSYFRDEEGRRYYAVCNNNQKYTAELNLTVREDLDLERSAFGNRFIKPNVRKNGNGTKTFKTYLASGDVIIFRDGNLF